MDRWGRRHLGTWRILHPDRLVPKCWCPNIALPGGLLGKQLLIRSSHHAGCNGEPHPASGTHSLMVRILGPGASLLRTRSWEPQPCRSACELQQLPSPPRLLILFIKHLCNVPLGREQAWVSCTVSSAAGAGPLCAQCSPDRAGSGAV